MTEICSDEVDLLQDVRFCRGKKSLPGVRPHAYVINKNDILRWPTLPGGNAKNLKDVPVYIDNFVLKADKKWAVIDLVPNQSEIKCDQVGNWGSEMFNNVATLVVPGTEEEATGLASVLNNSNVVILLPTRQGKIRVIGNEDFDVQIKPSSNTGKGSGDTNATTLEATVEDEVAAPFYLGVIETADGDVNGATDHIGELLAAPTYSVAGNSKVTITNPNASGTLYYTDTPQTKALESGDALFKSTANASIDVSYTSGGILSAYVANSDGTVISAVVTLTVTAPAA